MPDERLDARLDRIEAMLSNVATNVDVTALAASVRTLQRVAEATRDDVRVVTAIALRLEHTLTDALIQLQAMVQQSMRLGDRVRALEDRDPA
jgi:predicted  nucleic acid-binding Zn-ribbon protein